MFVREDWKPFWADRLVWAFCLWLNRLKVIKLHKKDRWESKGWWVDGCG